MKSDAPLPWSEDAMQVSGGADWNWWYADPRGLGDNILLHDAGKPYPEYYELFNPVYPIICYGGICIVLILLLWQKKLRKPLLKEVSARLAIIIASADISVFLVSSGRILISTVGIIDQYWSWMIPMNTVFLALTTLLWRQMYLLNWQDNAS